MEHIDSVHGVSSFNLERQPLLQPVRYSTLKGETGGKVPGLAVALISIQRLKRIICATSRDVTHGVVQYNNSGAELLLSHGAVRLSICASHESEHRIISSRDSSAGRLITMSGDVPKAKLNGRDHLMDRSWPTLLTVLFRNKLRVVAVLLDRPIEQDDGCEIFDVRPWSERDEAFLDVLTTATRAESTPLLAHP